MTAGWSVVHCGQGGLSMTNAKKRNVQSPRESLKQNEQMWKKALFLFDCKKQPSLSGIELKRTQIQRLQAKASHAEKESENIRRKRHEASELKRELTNKLELQRYRMYTGHPLAVFLFFFGNDALYIHYATFSTTASRLKTSLQISACFRSSSSSCCSILHPTMCY